MHRYLFVLLAIQACLGANTVTNLQLIDQQVGNFFFRGGDAVVNGVFQWDGLVAQMNTITTLPSEFYMVIINTLGVVPTDAANIAVEQAYFEANPSKGKTILRPLAGTDKIPSDYSPAVVESMARNLTAWMDDIPSVIALARSYLLTPTTIPTVIFTHCTCGCDRTGEFAESYYMQFQNKSITQARNINVQLIGREQVLTNLYAAWWYCYYLKYELSYNINCVYPDSEAIILPKCEVVAKQAVVSTSTINGTVYTSWIVYMSNTDTVDVSGVRFYFGGTKFPTAIWGGVAPAPQPPVFSYAPTIHPNENLQWGYTIALATAPNLLLISPTICLGAAVPVVAATPPPTPAPTPNPHGDCSNGACVCYENYFGADCSQFCGLSISQTKTNSWTGASQYNVNFNLGSTPVYDVQIQVDAHGATFTPYGGQFIAVAGKPNVYRLATYQYSNTAGTLSNSASFGYTIGSSSPASFRLYNNACVPPPCAAIAVSASVQSSWTNGNNKIQQVQLSLTNNNNEGAVANAAVKVNFANGAFISTGSNIAPTSSAPGAASQTVTCTTWNLQRGATSSSCSFQLSTPLASAQAVNADVSLAQGICVI